MSLIDNGNGLSAADIAAVVGNNGNGFGFGNEGGAWWLLILFLFAFAGNGDRYWGNGSNGRGSTDVTIQNDVQRGFDQQAVMSGLSGITTAVTNGFGNAEVAATNRQMASMQQAFAAQTAVDSRLDSIASSLQNCCCENRAQVADVKYTIANEAAATRAANQAGTQTIMDKLCQLEMDGMRQNYESQISGLKDQLSSLRTQLNAANGAASQNAQTAAILADNAAQTLALEQYLNPTPKPAFIVQNPNCCGNQFYGQCACQG